MKKIIITAIALLPLLAAPLARAWSYSDGDLLLIFREANHNNVEFDLGSVSNLLGKANGYTTTITGWNPSLVTGQFGSDLTGVEVVLAAVTSVTNASPAAWVSSPDPNVYAYNVGAWTPDLHGTISSLGNRPLSPFKVPAAAGTPTNAYSISPTDAQYGGASYDYIVSGGNYRNVPTWNGTGPFFTVPVEQTIPGSFDFWQIEPASSSPTPPDQLIGTFTISASGVLTFVAGPRPSNIAGVNYSQNVSAVQFSTTVGNHYSVAYTNHLGAIGAWPVDSNVIVGDGRLNTINHTNANPGVEFYRINTQ